MPRPYGPIGLVLSVPVILLLAAAYFLVVLGIGGLAYAGLCGLSRLGYLIAGLGHALASGDLGPWLLPIFALGLPLYAAVFAAVMTVAVWRGGGEWRSLIAWTEWSPLKAPRAYWVLVAIGVAYGIAASVLVSLIYPQAAQWEMLPKGALGAAVSYLIVVLAAPAAEEVFFRGWIFTSLRARISFWPANIVTAALFATAHWERTHLYAAAVFPLGLMLGLAREKTGSTKASGLFHACYNAIALTLTFIGPS